MTYTLLYSYWVNRTQLLQLNFSRMFKSFHLWMTVKMSRLPVRQLNMQHDGSFRYLCALSLINNLLRYKTHAYICNTVAVVMITTAEMYTWGISDRFVLFYSAQCWVERTYRFVYISLYAAYRQCFVNWYLCLYVEYTSLSPLNATPHEFL
jgi:hypothetical protein